MLQLGFDRGGKGNVLVNTSTLAWMYTEQEEREIHLVKKKRAVWDSGRLTWRINKTRDINNQIKPEIGGK